MTGRNGAGGAGIPRRLGVLFATVPLLVVSACSAPAVSASALGDAVLAMYLSPQTYAFEGPGEVLIVRPDGSTASVRTSGMDNGQLLWTDSGLSFADTEHDYLLNDQLRSWASAKTNFQDILVETPEGVLGSYNDGNDGSGYVEQVVLSTDGRSTLSEVAGFNRLFSLCEGGLVGLAEVTGAELTDLAARSGAVKRSSNDFPQMLTWLHPKRATASQTLIAAVPSPVELDYPRGLAPCPDGVITHLADLVRPGGANTFEVWRWDTRTGRRARTELKRPDGSALGLTSDQFSTSTIASQLDEEGRLVWFCADGRVLATDPETGVTEELWHSGLPVDQDNDTHVLFEGKWVFLLDVPNDDQRRPMTLYRRNAFTGEGGPVVVISGVNETRSVQRVLRGIAVAPSLIG